MATDKTIHQSTTCFMKLTLAQVPLGPLAPTGHAPAGSRGGGSCPLPRKSGAGAAGLAGLARTAGLGQAVRVLAVRLAVHIIVLAIVAGGLLLPTILAVATSATVLRVAVRVQAVCNASIPSESQNYAGFFSCPSSISVVPRYQSLTW